MAQLPDKSNDQHFEKASQDWDIDSLVIDIKKKDSEQPLTSAVKRNLRAVLLVLSPKEAALEIGISESSLKPAFSKIYRLIETLTGAKANTVSYKNAYLLPALASYRKQQTFLPSPTSSPFDLLNRNSIPTKNENIAPSQALTGCNASFVGRDRVLAELDRLFVQNRLVLIQGEGGLGKSTVARFYCQSKLHDFYKLGTVGSSDIANAESLVDRWLQEFFGEEPSRQDFSIKLTRLRKHLQDDDHNICFVIDNLESALVNGKFKKENNRYVDLLGVLSDPFVRSITLITSRERIYEHGIKFHLYELLELDPRSWHEYFHSYQIQVSEQSLEDSSSALNQMHKTYGGNAECMSVLGGDILSAREYGNSLEAYWAAKREDLLAHRTIESLIRRQFEILQRDSPLAYKLLCRMGCYRYEDAVATVPEDGIVAMLWEDELNPRTKQRTIKELRDRCLIKFSDRDKGYFLHPVMREEAVNRLKDERDKWTKEGEEANRKAANFWSDLVLSVESFDLAMKALESTRHYLAINDFESAASEMSKRRQNNSYKHEYGEYLLNSVERLGLSLNIIRSVHIIVRNIAPSQTLVKIHEFLGHYYYLIGDINMSISSYQKVKEISEMIKCLDYQIIGLIMIGITNLSAFEIDNADKSFTLALNLTEFIKEDRLKYLKGYVYFCLALTKSIQKIDDIIKIDNLLAQSNKIMSLCNLSTWGGAFYPLFSGMAYQNTNQIENAMNKYEESIDFAKKSGYKEVEGIGISLKATILRFKQDYNSAIKLHLKAEKLLFEVGDKCDLAEAYFQCGLTYQAMGEHDQVAHFVEYYKAKSLKLFEQMKAPKQIERVNQAFEQGAKQ